MTTLDAVVVGTLLAGALAQLRFSGTRFTSFADRFLGFVTFTVLGVRVAWLALISGVIACVALLASSRWLGRIEARERAKIAATSTLDIVAAVAAAHAVVRALGGSYPLAIAPFSSLGVQLGFWGPSWAYLLVTIVVDTALVRFVLAVPADDPRLERIEPEASSLFTALVASVPLIVITRVLYDPSALLPFYAALGWAFLLNVAFARLLSRRRRIGVLLDELSTKERLAAVGEVSARVVHHTRHQLALIGISTHRIEKRIASLPSDDAKVVREELDKLADVQREMSSMLTSVLRSTSDEPGARPSSASYADLVTGVARRLDALAVSRGVRLVVSDLSPAERAFPAHPDNVSDAIFNVLENALVAARDEVTVAAEVRGDKLVVAIRDDGDGMPSAVMARAKNAVITTKADGTGMGLVLARAAVEGEQGALVIKNRGQGGCEVELAVPLRVP